MTPRRILFGALLLACVIVGASGFSPITASGPRLFSSSSSSSSSSSGGGSVLDVRAPNATTDKWVDLDSSSNGSGTQASPYQKSQLNLAIYQALTCGQQLVFLNASGTGTYTPINLTSGLASCSESTRITVRTYPGHTKARWNFQTEGNSYHLSYWDFRDLDFRTDGCGFRMGYNGWGGGHSPSQGGAVDGDTDHVRLIDIDGTRTSGGVLDGKTDGLSDNRGIITGAWGNGSSDTANFIGIYRGNFTGPTNDGNSNAALIWFDYMRDFEIIGNAFTNSAIPIYLKHTDQTSDANQNAVIANNIFVSCSRAVEASMNYVVWTNNAFQSCKLGIDEAGGSPVHSSDNNTLNHNTFLNSDWMNPDINQAPANNTALNNVMVGTSRWADEPFRSNNNNNLINYSAVAGSGTAHYYRNSNGTLTMAQYKSAYSTNEVNGVAGTLTLVGGTTPGLTAANWALSPGSVGIGDASDGGDRGVNATLLRTAESATYHAFNFNLDDERERYAANDDEFRLRANR